MKVIYIAGKFTGKNSWEVEQNIRRAEELALKVAERCAMPLTPHTNSRFFHGTLTEQFWYDGTLELMRRCDAVMLVDNWKYSTGAKAEVKEAKRLGLPVFDHLGDLVRWLGENPVGGGF